MEDRVVVVVEASAASQLDSFPASGKSRHRLAEKALRLRSCSTTCFLVVGGALLPETDSAFAFRAVPSCAFMAWVSPSVSSGYLSGEELTSLPMALTALARSRGATASKTVSGSASRPSRNVASWATAIEDRKSVV